MNRTTLTRLLGLMARVATSSAAKQINRSAISDLLCMLEVLGYDDEVVKEALAIVMGEASPEWLVEYRNIAQARTMRRGQA